MCICTPPHLRVSALLGYRLQIQHTTSILSLQGSHVMIYCEIRERRRMLQDMHHRTPACSGASWSATLTTPRVNQSKPITYSHGWRSRIRRWYWLKDTGKIIQQFQTQPSLNNPQISTQMDPHPKPSCLDLQGMRHQEKWFPSDMHGAVCPWDHLLNHPSTTIMFRYTRHSCAF